MLLLWNLVSAALQVFFWAPRTQVENGEYSVSPEIQGFKIHPRKWTNGYPLLRRRFRKNTAIQKPWIFTAICYFFGGEVDISWVFLHEGSDQQKHLLLYIGYVSSEWNQAYTTLVPNYYSYNIIETVAWIKAPMWKSYFKWRGFSGDSDSLQDLSVKIRCQEKVKKTLGWNFIPWPGIHC